ncbi:hypothetical protein BDR26DRAFT_74292 [Obelidium mucronatum]|nr:hypothetical protein BDR26DRAFT_74292 [Obelidium mucronatum]
MLVRRFFSPTHVNTVLNFVLGMGWLFAQAVVRVMVGEAVWASTALPRVGSKLDTSSLAKEQPDDSVGLNMELNRRKSQGLEELLKKSGDGNSMGTTPRTSATALLRKERRLTIS